MPLAEIDLRPYTPTPMQKTVVTLLSTHYSGSHFLTSMLGSHSKAIYVGEVLHLRKPGEITHAACPK